jgi:endonuclease/exonuclease/phosphatase (EEP) superfamily protein YafD
VRTAVLVTSWICIVATILPLIRREAWWIRVFDFPRNQIAVLGVASAAGLGLTWGPGATANWITLGALAACLAYQGWEMSLYTPLRRVQSLRAESDDPARRLRILTANVLQFNRNFGQYVDLIRQSKPDIVVLCETDAGWEEAMRAIERDYPFHIKCPLSNTYGMLLYSRLPLSEQQVLFRVEEDVPSFSTLVKLEMADQFELHAIHPRPPHVGVDTVERDAELVIVGKQVRDSRRAVIVTGDLNDVAWSHTTRLFLRLSRLLDPRVGRAFCNTFHARHPLLRWPLDHLFHSRAFRLVKLQRGPKTASDHFPVIVELSYEPEEKHEHERPVADAEDFQEAREKIDNLADR